MHLAQKDPQNGTCVHIEGAWCIHMRSVERFLGGHENENEKPIEKVEKVGKVYAESFRSYTICIKYSGTILDKPHPLFIFQSCQAIRLYI